MLAQDARARIVRAVDAVAEPRRLGGKRAASATNAGTPWSVDL
jgi:hypothetical protein